MHSKLDSSNIGFCSLTFYFSPSFVASISIVCNPFTGSLAAGHSITPSLAASSATNRCVSAKLCLNKWMCFLPLGRTSFSAEPGKNTSLFVTSELYCISHTSGDRYFSGRQIDTSVAYSLLTALQITRSYLYIPCMALHLFQITTPTSIVPPDFLKSVIFAVLSP